MKNLLVDKFLFAFKQEFSSTSILVEKVDTGGSQIHSVFVGNLDAEGLKNDWVRITNFIAIQYQSKLESDFERWNLYLFFLLYDELIISDDLKYTIENNTFSSRKIIENSSLSAEVIIKKHITNELSLYSDIKRAISYEFSYNSIIYDVLKDKTIKKKNILSEQLNLAYTELVNKYRKEEE